MRTIWVTSFLVALFFIPLVHPAFGQTSMPPDAVNEASLPKVFQLGEHDRLYENVLPGYQTLLEACDGDMMRAFEKLYSMMKEMEAFAKILEYDLNGINAWMHFFWKEDGSIEHIGFHLKPVSKHVDVKILQRFLDQFASQYQFPLKTDLRFSHYSTFVFPVF